MAVRTPVYVTSGGNLRDMTTAMIDSIKDRAKYLYVANPSITLSRAASNGNLDAMNDTRKTAGAASSNTSFFVAESSTAEPGTTTVTWDNISQTVGAQTQPSDTDSYRFPLYRDANNDLQAMSRADMYSTFINDPASDLGGGGTEAGTYRIYNSNALSGYTLVNSSPVFADTRADTSLYTNAGLPEALDQPKTINSYYLLRKNNISNPSITMPARFNGTNITADWETDFDTALEGLMRYTIRYRAGYKIRYTINGSGTTQGTSMVDTRLNGAGNYQIRQDGSTYYAQEFPNGSSTTISTYNLKLNVT